MNRILGVLVLVLFLVLLTRRILGNPGPARQGVIPCGMEPKHIAFGETTIWPPFGTNPDFTARGRGPVVHGPPIADELGWTCLTGDPDQGFRVVDRQGRYVHVSGHPDYERTDAYSVFERIGIRAAKVPHFALLALFALVWPWLTLRLFRNPPETAPWLGLIGTMASAWAIVPFTLWL